MESRVEFCKNMLKYKGSKLKKTFFSDEMDISLTDLQPKKAWHPPHKEVTAKKVQRNIKFNCWAAISYNGATSLEIFDPTLNRELYMNILKKHLDEMNQLYKVPYYFQQDNLAVHTSTFKWQTEQGLNLVDFPIYSPDLSPIENLWSSLKHSVSLDDPKTKAQLKESLLKNWHDLTEVGKLRNYFENLADRYRECIDKRGERLPY